jgi:8-oxo-dGTP pyrophosphatase MutT (NUDIX family)
LIALLDAQHLPRLRDRLRERKPVPITEGVVRRAAVAAILRVGESGIELCLIRRAEREGDRWSGHMAFPGGVSEPDDRDLLATAIRETQEEIGLDLEAHGEVLGQLDDVQAGGSRRPSGVIATPYVFAVRGEIELRPNDEVAEVIWAPIAPLLRGEVDCTFDYPWEGKILKLPGFKVGERIVWGMTYRMLEILFEEIRLIVHE